MAEITANLVKTLREMTGAGMMECKKALVAAEGDIERAVDDMRKSGQAKAAKKAGRIAAEGLIIIKSDQASGIAVMVEVNCETDFVAKDGSFSSFCTQVAELALQNQVDDITRLKELCEPQRVALVAQLGENINLRRMIRLQGEALGHYLHNSRIGVLVATKGKADEALLKQIAMHIAASKPEFILLQDLPPSVIERERQVQLTIVNQSGIPSEHAAKEVEKRLNKFVNSLALNEQPFIIDPRKKVGEVLKSNGVEVASFTRFEVGEGIERIATDFAAEVAAASQVSGAPK